MGSKYSSTLKTIFCENIAIVFRVYGFFSSHILLLRHVSRIAFVWRKVVAVDDGTVFFFFCAFNMGHSHILLTYTKDFQVITA